MKFHIEDKALHVRAESPAEVLEMVKHYGLDVLTCADALASGALVHVVKPSARDGGEWFPLVCTIGADFMAPYLAKLTHWTGFAGEVPPLDCPRYPGGYCVNLCHTHIVESARMSSAGFTFSGFIHSSDWNGRSAAERAPGLFGEYCRAAVGDTKREPEFLEVGNGGLLRRNPNYLRHHAPHAAASSAAIFESLLQWWIATHATPRQRDILAQCIANHRTVCKRDTLGAYLLRAYDPGYRVSWDGPLISLESFKAGE